MFCCVRPAASGVLFEDDGIKASGDQPKGKGGKKKTMEMLVLDGTMETPAVTCREIIPWVASPWVLAEQKAQLEEMTLALSDITTLELLLLVNPHRGREWARETELQGCGKETWQAETERCQCLHDGLYGTESVLEVLALISPRHLKDHLAEQRRAQKVAAEIEAMEAWDRCFDNSKQQAGCGWFGRVVLLLVVVLLFVCCIVAASDPILVSELASVMESGRTAAVSVVESAVSALDGIHYRLN